MTTNIKLKVQGILVTETGGPEVLRLSQVEVGEPGPGQVRLKLHAAGLNYIDIYQRNGRYPVQYPWTPGLEASGEVESVGPNVEDVRVGDRVAYTSCPNSYAAFNIVPVDKLIPLPKELTFDQGAAFPLQGLTAHYLLFEFYKIKQGDNILIHAAAGGMGLLLTQWAKHLGARVIGTVSTEAKAKLAREAGADDVVLYSQNDFVEESKKLTNGEGPVYIIDGVGKDTFTKNLEAVKRRGHVTIFGAASGVADPLQPNSLQQRSITVHGGSLYNYLDTREELLMRANAVLEGIKAGWLKLNISEKLPLKDAAKAHEDMAGRKTTGKIILDCQSA